MWENIKSKFNRGLAHKVLVLMMIFVLVMASSKPKEEAHAIAPALLIVAEAIAIEIAVDLGWKFVAKPALKKVAQKVGKEVFDNADYFDFAKTKPKKNGKSLDIDVSALDRAKIAKMLKDEAGDVIEADTFRRTNYDTKWKSDVDYVNNVDPLYNTHLNLTIKLPQFPSSADRKAYDYMRRFVDIHITPQTYEQKSRVEFVDTITGIEVADYYLEGKGYDYPLTVMGSGTTEYVINMTKPNGNQQPAFVYPPLGGGYDYPVISNNLQKSWKVFENYLYTLEQTNKTIYLADGVSVPEDNKRIYDIDVKTPSTYQLPDKLAVKKPFKLPIPNADDSIIDIEWEDVETTYSTDIDNYYTKIVNDYDVSTNYTYITNNYYTIDDGDPTQEEIDNDITIIINNPPAVPDDDDGGGIPVVDDPDKAVRVYDRTLVGYIKSVYEYLADGIDNSISALKDITDGASGLVAFLDASFDWLPNEWRAMFGSAFMLGVVAHFLRR